mmetsp:Transcript_43531/g.53431  ORF Transcript_43531/g.53431 Transcript_43531/m.53431 type:complete len:164 (-) Transcript_43531:15-506(-)
MEISSIIEKHISTIILQPKAHEILKICENRTRKRNMKLHSQCLKLKNKNRLYFGIKDNVNLNDAIHEFKKIKKLILPYEKIDILQNVSRYIHANFKELDADNFNNVAVYVFVQSCTKMNPPITFGESLFIEGLMSKQQSLGQSGYYFTAFKSVIEYIINHQIS